MPRSWPVIATIALLVAGCGGSASGFEQAVASLPELELFVTPVPDAPDPADRAGAAAMHVECVHPLWNGGWSADFGPPGAGSTSDRALDAFLSSGLFGLPAHGYALGGKAPDRVLYTYAVTDVPKVAIIVANESDGWRVETFASCDPAEYDPTTDGQISIGVWTDDGGERVPTSIIMSLAGAEHCGWESVTYLLFENRQYISDPEGVMDVPFVTAFDPAADLPSDAVDTGYRREDRELWLSQDRRVAYLVSGDRVETWPTPDTAEPVWCA